MSDRCSGKRVRDKGVLSSGKHQESRITSAIRERGSQVRIRREECRGREGGIRVLSSGKHQESRITSAIRERGSQVRIRRREECRGRVGGDRSSHAEPLLAQIEGRG